MDVDAIKERNRHIWGLGDYAALSEALRPAAEALADACAVSAGQEVLDVAAGDGNFALVCAREGASVVASDLSPGMVERGRARAQAEGYDVEWVEADAEALPFEDASFDCVGSVFGAMIAPRPRIVAEELFRVVRPGGTVGMTAWTFEGFSSELFRLGRSYAPPSDQPLSEEWSAEENVRERFDGLAARFELERRELAWEADSPEALVAMLGTSAPPWVAAKQNLPPERWDSLVAEALELAQRWAGDERPIRLENEIRADRGSQARVTARLLLEYDGSDFGGWARQPGVRTVEGTLEDALATVLRHEVRLSVAGRTDRGVHARGQVVSHGGEPAPRRNVNALLAPDVAVLASEAAPDGFDARRDARSRTYRYRLHTRSAPSPFEQGRALWWPRPLDREALDACAAALLGTHDFTAFTPSETDHVRFERDVYRAEWVQESEDVVAFWIEADTFMRHMVRVIVGTMLEGVSPERFAELLTGHPRSDAGATAAPHGLYLESVAYS